MGQLGYVSLIIQQASQLINGDKASFQEWAGVPAQNWHNVISVSFCLSKQDTGTMQIQGGKK